MVLQANDTITAISTPHGPGGIGIVRISGPDAPRIACAIFRQFNPQGKIKSTTLSHVAPQFIPRRMYHGYISAPGQSGVVDEVLLVFMPAPKSYTSEDIIEIQAHAGTIVLKAILDLVLEQGARLAEPGEFTRRAYLNGRLDLSQAEAVIDVIQAKTEASLKIASRHLEGNIGWKVKEIKTRILDVHANLEADIEFPEDVEESDDNTNIYIGTLKEVIKVIDEILDGYKKGHMLRDGLKLTIVGKVNVGKSSLLNRFLQKERAIVTEIPGTTRDHIEETLDIFGLPVILIDTAGWRDTNDPVEKIGIERTRSLVEEADLVLFMVDADRGISDEDHDIYRRTKKKEKILVINKTDLKKGTKTIHIPKEWGISDIIHTSVKFDQGIDTLKKRIYRFGAEGWKGQESVIVPNLRQKTLFMKARNAVDVAREGIEEKRPQELTVVDLKEAVDALDEITGVSVRTDVLDAVFSRFCIGK